MTSRELLKQGHLAAAIEAQIVETRARPTDVDARFFLFVLFGYSGDLERAWRQLEALSAIQPELELTCAVYRNLLASEAERRRVLHDGATPLTPPDAPEHLQHRVRALQAMHAGDHEAAETALAAAAEASPTPRGRVDGQPFTAIRDYDDVLGSVLEIFVGGRCLWMPFERIRKLEIPAPGRVLDLLWTEARLQGAEGKSADVYVPALYEASWRHDDEQVKLGRMTTWTDSGPLGFRGAGQRSLLVQDEGAPERRELGILALRTLEIEATVAAGGMAG